MFWPLPFLSQDILARSGSQPRSALGLGERLESLLSCSRHQSRHYAGAARQRIWHALHSLSVLKPFVWSLALKWFIKYLENPITVNEMMAVSVNLTFPSPLLFLPFLGSTFWLWQSGLAHSWILGAEQANETWEVCVGGGGAISRNCDRTPT